MPLTANHQLAHAFKTQAIFALKKKTTFNVPINYQVTDHVITFVRNIAAVQRIRDKATWTIGTRSISFRDSSVSRDRSSDHGSSIVPRFSRPETRYYDISSISQSGLRSRRPTIASCFWQHVSTYLLHIHMIYCPWINTRALQLLL